MELGNAELATDRFVASMSHELRTPLKAVIGFIGTLSMMPVSLLPERTKQLRALQASSRLLLSLIDDLLELAKIESGKVEINRERVECRRVVEDIVTALWPAAEIKGLTLEATVSPPDLCVQADRRALSQILLNLINNGIKFTERGSVSLRVGRRQEGARRLTEFSVTDTGIGIRAEDQAKLFQAFTQVDALHGQRHEGTEPGLHLSRQLAELLGGQITVRSLYGKGTTFTLRLEGPSG